MLRQKLQNKRAFTLIELLVVISVITLLMAVFGISANRVRHVSQNLNQRAQIHSMEVGLELFKKDFGNYPASAPIQKGGGYVYGAQHLTEALFGRDLAGIELGSKFHAAGDGKVGGQVAGADIPNYYEPEEEQSKNRRKGPYMQFGKGGVSVAYMQGSPDMPAGGVSLYDDISATNIYTSNSNEYADRAPVITDIFRQKRITLSDGQNAFVGTPVLYFRANTASNIFRPSGANYGLPYGGYQNWKYDYYDNFGFYKLPHLQEPENTQLQHRFDNAYTHTDGRGGIEYFYDYITNFKVESFRQPQNANGFIIISAGRDGVFGTKDDVTNFELQLRE